jgi:hypothetical protein
VYFASFPSPDLLVRDMERSMRAVTLKRTEPKLMHQERKPMPPRERPDDSRGWSMDDPRWG